MLYQCSHCALEFESREELKRHSLQLHGTVRQEIDPSDLDDDAERESIVEAELTDAVIAAQQEPFDDTPEAEAMTGGSAAGGSTAYGEGSATSAPADASQEVEQAAVPDDLERPPGQPAERQSTPAAKPDATLGDLIDPRSEYRCERCGEVFPHREDLDRHIWLQHRREQRRTA